MRPGGNGKWKLTCWEGPLATPPIEIEGARTPPIPSSSPGIPDMMDVSPLPHKAPYFVAQVTLPSPSPEVTPDAVEMISPDLLSPHEIAPPSHQTLLALPEYVACISLPIHAMKKLTWTKTQKTSDTSLVQPQRQFNYAGPTTTQQRRNVAASLSLRQHCKQWLVVFLFAELAKQCHRDARR